MNILFYAGIEKILTKSRLSVYRQDGCDNITAIARYLYNIEICKSLYPALHIFEISLRNSIDSALTIYAKDQKWYDIVKLNHHSQLKIDEAKKKIMKKNKTVTHDRLIAELTLGFWTIFLTKTYSQCAFQSFIIKNCLRQMPKNLRNIGSIQIIFEKLRTLRNRVSHYERLIHWTDLIQQHNQLLECIKYLNQNAYDMIKEIDTFEKTINLGINPFVSFVKSHWN